MQETITVGDIKAAQDGWCNAVTALSKTYAESGFEASKRLASEVKLLTQRMAISSVQSHSSQPGPMGKQLSVRPRKVQCLTSLVGILSTEIPALRLLRLEMETIQIFKTEANG